MFMCLVFSFPDTVSCYFYLFYSLLDLSCGECNGMSLYFLCCFVNGSVCLVFLTVFVETIRIFGVAVILLLNVMEVLSGWRCSVG